MAAKTCYPGAQVTIFRTEQQAQADNLPQDLDITPYIGEGGSISTAKDLYNPKGRWEVVIPDKPWGKAVGSGSGQSSSVVDTIYGLIAPMNVVEIRLARNAYKYTNRLPVIMRGFVRDVAREEAMGEDGQPARFVRLSGDDYGCIGEIVKLHQFFGASGQYLNPIMRLNDLAINTNPLPAAVYMKTLLDELWNQQLLLMFNETGNNALRPVKFDGDQVKKGVVSTAQIATNNGTAWKLMMDKADTPWNELFIEDRDIEIDGEEGPFLVYRPTPYADLETILQSGDNAKDNEFIENTGQKIDPSRIWTVVADDDESAGDEFVMMRSANYRRHDREVYNIFWVTGEMLKFAADKQMATAIAKEVADVHSLHYKNSQVEIYGARPLELNSSHMPAGTQPHHTADNPEQSRVNISDWTKLRRQWLMAANKDNVMFDEGELSVHGNEQLRIGSYYLVRRGHLQVQHYIIQVSHHFVPYREFTTTLGFIRANNHYQREVIRGNGLSPFFLEGRQGVLED